MESCNRDQYVACALLNQEKYGLLSHFTLSPCQKVLCILHWEDYQNQGCSDTDKALKYYILPLTSPPFLFSGSLTVFNMNITGVAALTLPHLLR